MKRRRVITVAISAGAHAEQVGQAVAGRLGYRYVNEEIIDRAAEKAGVDRTQLQEVERSQSLVARILTALGTVPAPEIPAWTGNESVVDPSPAYRALIQQVIRETATDGEVVIVAHAAGMLLAGMPDLLRVFVTAPLETRTARVAAERGIDEREARRLVERSDRERAAYFQRFYSLRQELPTHYDLVVNTDTLTPESAATAIVCASEA